MEKDERLMFLQGNEACVEGALAAGCRFFAGYPITPSSEIAEVLSQKLPEVGGKFIQMEDEIASMGAVIGASLTGIKSMTATSGPGFSLKQENLGYACLCEIPCVVVNVMRGGPSTGLPTSPAQSDVMQARWGTHGDHPIIALCPSSVAEAFDVTVRAFNLSEKYRTPVILLMDEVIGHMREPMRVPRPEEIEIIDRVKPSCPPEKYFPYDHPPNDINPMASFGEGYRYHVTGLNHDRTGFPTMDPAWVQADGLRLLRKIERNRADIITYQELYLNDADVAVVAYGGVARSAKNAVTRLRKEGCNVGLFRPITIWPFPEERIRELAKQVRTFVVAEMNLGQLVLEVERAARGEAVIEGVFLASGELITPEAIYNKVREVAYV